eukprot:CAMPEP_0196664924 /NCGR_PEP_ID=MMETSP1086-20130531/58970_1 /TAXON_ID=77921 /ORGANISM="Cyanoptyche  gloeocystis , Strain SAG4.97" /LENGTH=119 /DNA_ID=CAMNT_0042001431 /DNA_START=251 /DNA_END=610 /DNA_ORIENTATION=-
MDIDFQPAVDVDRGDKDVVIRAEVPGFKKDDIKLDLADGTLTIRAETRSRSEDDHFAAQSEFYESLFVPELRAVHPEEVSADYKNGVLVLKVPRKETPGRGTIQIRDVSESGETKHLNQ